jgi:formylglycine-generating enzyme required for sulfatase activity
VLTDLVAGLDRFLSGSVHGNGVADVERRLAFARTVRTRTIGAPQWAEAIASIASLAECPQYGGLVLAPQEGLVPIGRDPGSGLWEFWDVATGERPERDADGYMRVTEGMGLVFVLLPGGRFHMGAVRPSPARPLGSSNVDPRAQLDESGQSGPVTVAAFFLSKYEMTQGQWLRCVGENPSGNQGSDESRVRQPLTCPVEQVSWEICDRVLTRLGLVLPTEAQWEYACRAGTTLVWYTGNDPESVSGAAHAEEPEGDRPAPVGGYRPNAFGLHDVIGNVYEWCRDWYVPYSVPVRGGDGLRQAPSGLRKVRVLRGGDWGSDSKNLRSAARFQASAQFRLESLGVRPARPVRD